MKTTDSILTKNQKKTFRYEYPNGNVLIATVRYDDECGNGHNSFAITGDLYDRKERIPGEASTTNSKGKTRWLGACGCLHDEIAKAFPHLAPFFKWHLTSSDGPMHYIANTVYHASNRDHRGLLKGEKRQLVNGRTKEPVWIVGEGKERNLDHARSSAVWPEATDETLSLPADELTEIMKARHPALMAEFRAAVESLGFTF